MCVIPKVVPKTFVEFDFGRNEHWRKTDGMPTALVYHGPMSPSSVISIAKVTFEEFRGRVEATIYLRGTSIHDFRETIGPELERGVIVPAGLSLTRIAPETTNCTRYVANGSILAEGFSAPAAIVEIFVKMVMALAKLDGGAALQNHGGDNLPIPDITQRLYELVPHLTSPDGQMALSHGEQLARMCYCGFRTAPF
ncbi:MAG: hypothetical protein COV10_03645 [Candidatus Vogelbacteria bacterium CG10_big_fil_rev_8_21_14_0_10_51_16]|uniref:Uncharacterized protein n=1 Tax=Candidatus Vogelbacteria bacterium CG10_big_fil_rev_8_21_14_0_10_51_16 TaxID=1975045 RepID=A0A2H0RDF1_9BACT|nr:MAG: hypothetical protein COV10_03645 [Candidatus Vogelbacteria bacterium CG10_big_fil_rev_8_21_14_0_10_51_16]